VTANTHKTHNTTIISLVGSALSANELRQYVHHYLILDT